LVNIEFHMAAGFAHIITMGSVRDSGGTNIQQYQFTYSGGESSYARIFDEPHLIEFLREDLGLYADILNRVLSELRSKGNTVLSDIHIDENEAASMGLLQVASDN
jgi:hypothetical protein